MAETDRRSFLKLVSGALASGLLLPSGAYAAEESQLEKDIDSFVKSMRSCGRIYKDSRTAWIVYDLDSDEKIVSINEDRPMQAASMIKGFVALAVLHQASEGKISYSPKIADEIKYSIWKSDNCATNSLIERAGGPEILEDILRNNYPGITKDVSITDYIPLTGRNIARAKARSIRAEDVPRGKSYYSNLASAHDYCGLLHALWHNNLPRSRMLKRVMSLGGPDRIHDKANIPEYMAVYNKTGTTARCIGDHGILVPRDKRGRKKPYILVGIIDTPERKSLFEFSRLGGDLIGGVSDIVYRHMKDKYCLR